MHTRPSQNENFIPPSQTPCLLSLTFVCRLVQHAGKGPSFDNPPWPPGNPSPASVSAVESE
eukprot:2064283-Amphidinium_carterae.1